MTKSYTEITQRITRNAGGIGKARPGAMKGFRELSGGALEDGALDLKTKEYIALAIGVAKQCDGCIGFHTKKLVELGVTREEIAEVLGVCIYMGGGPGLMYASEAMHAFEEFSGGTDA